METLINSATSAGEALFHAPVWFLLLIALNLVGVFMDRIECINNLFIPVVLAGMGITLLILLSDPDSLPKGQRHPEIVFGIMGLIVGVVAYGLHFVLIAMWKKWISDKFPCVPNQQKEP